VSPFKRLLRKIPALRWCAMQYALRTRHRQQEASWIYVQSVLTTIGNITIQWAMIELFLAHLIVWHHCKRGLRPERGWPRMLAFQLDHVKKIENDGSVDAPTAAKLAAIRKRISDLNDFRISVIHGVLHQKNRWTQNWHTYAVKIDGLDARVEERTYSNEEIQAKAKEMSDLAHEMSPFIAGIVGIPHPLNSR
jgi:hypothetical protein